MQPGRFVYLGAMRAFDTDRMVHKAQNIYSLALYGKSLQTSDLNLSVIYCYQ